MSQKMEIGNNFTLRTYNYDYSLKKKRMKVKDIKNLQTGEKE